MGTALLSIIGSLIVFLLGIMLYMVKSTRQDIEKLQGHVDESLEDAKKEIMIRVAKPDCVREMSELKSDIKEIFRDIRESERDAREDRRSK
jgi:predicted Holliday junction resolvase-like endonuclease